MKGGKSGFKPFVPKGQPTRETGSQSAGVTKSTRGPEMLPKPGSLGTMKAALVPKKKK